MDKITFTVYDVFGYIIPGGLFAFSLHYFFPGLELGNVFKETIVDGLVGIFLIYVLGQLIATPSAFLLESLFIKKYLLDSRQLLLTPRKEIKGFKRMFPRHFEPLPCKIRISILSKFGLKENHIITTDESDLIYQVAFSKVKTIEKALDRLYIFLNLYGFARNISFICLLVTLILLTNSIITYSWINNYWMLGIFCVSIIMLYRFLKFYRHYNYDLYLSFLSYKESK